MLKIVPLALGLLTVLSIAPTAQAFPLHQPQLSITIGGQQPIYRSQPRYQRNSRYNYRAAELRRLELERERQRELAAERRRRLYQSRHNTGIYNTGIYRTPVSDRGGYNSQGHYNR